MPVLDLPILHIALKDAAELPAVAEARLQDGQIDGRKLFDIAGNDIVRKSVIYMLSVMCAPDGDRNTHARISYAADLASLSRTIDLAGEGGLRGDNDAQSLSMIQHREPITDAIKGVVGSKHLGHLVSGYILRWVILQRMDSNTKAQGSVAKAAKDFETKHGKGLPGSKAQNITRYIWPKYRNVSHLWAAFFSIGGAGVDILSPTGFLTFCGMAQWYLEEGCRSVRHGKSNAEAVLLADEVWTIPEELISRTADGTVEIYLPSASLDREPPDLTGTAAAQNR
jgi:hypothetical protein